MASLDEKIGMVANMIAAAGKVVIFTGAGVSTESGIPDFRSPGGVWTKFDPDDFTIDKYLGSAETRRKQWRILSEGGLLKSRPEPNKAHIAIAELEAMGKCACVITQNVDNLHQAAGNDPEKVYELHGNMQWITCVRCHARYPVEEFVARHGLESEVPGCEQCQGILKPDVVFFGEALPAGTLDAATHHAATCDLFIVIGSSLVVYPAAYMPLYAKEAGAKLVIITKSGTPFDTSADVVINESAGHVMERVVDEVRKII
jgi:NAD-dependent deacetylase